MAEITQKKRRILVRPNPKAMRALEAVRHLTQFGTSTKHVLCSKEGCGCPRWSKSKGGRCWAHAGSYDKARHHRHTEHGRRLRELNLARRLAKERSYTLTLSREAAKVVNRYRPNLIKRFDEPGLICAAFDWVDMQSIDRRTFFMILSEISNIPQR